MKVTLDNDRHKIGSRDGSDFGSEADDVMSAISRKANNRPMHPYVQPFWSQLEVMDFTVKQKM